MTTTTNCRSHRRPPPAPVCLLTGALAALATHAPAQAQASAHYTLHATGTKATLGVIPLTVELRLEHPRADRTVFAIPVWTPGSYRLRDFPERITPLAATAGERQLQVERLRDDAWQVQHGAVPELTLRYRVDLHPSDRFMDPGETRRCITYEGPAVYLYVRGQTDLPCRIHFDLPDGWSAASGLEPTPDGGYAAPSYDVLADCPVKLGQFQQFTFTSHDAQIDAVLDCATELQFDAEKWTAGLKAIVDGGGDIFGGLPVRRYVFLYTLSRSGGGGGLEHLDCTAIGLPAGSFRANPASSYGVSAHEFFHCWNVKRLRPIELGPFRYDRPNRTTGLWLAEGVTSYYGSVLMARAGHTTSRQFWNSMANAITALENTPGRHHTSPEQASLRVWDKQPPDRTVDYYGAGEVLGLLLDLQIRHATRNQQSLDDAMRALWRSCEEQGRGLTAEEIAAVVSRTAGTDLTPFFDQHVSGTLVPDYARLLACAGLAYQRETTHEQVLRGVVTRTNAPPTFADQAAIERSGGGDPLGTCGRIRTIDGKEIKTAADIPPILAAADRPTLAVEFETPSGEVRTANAALEERQRGKVTLTPLDNADPLALAIAAGITSPKKM
ncbi:MAG TPA: hypothetical protein VK348_02935 [Planctomycetota bacterium]|nr:hypothetical protein [Planctomycetota bacterium]